MSKNTKMESLKECVDLSKKVHQNSVDVLSSVTSLMINAASHAHGEFTKSIKRELIPALETLGPFKTLVEAKDPSENMAKVILKNAKKSYT